VAGEAFAGALNEQLTAAAVRPILPAANAALVALMQNSSNAAATISMVNLMALPPKDIATFAKRFRDTGFSRFHYITEVAPFRGL
jgi:hypothetical protein